MTDRANRKRRRLSLEILLLIFICAVISALLYGLLCVCAAAAVDYYVLYSEAEITDDAIYVYNMWIRSASLCVSCIVFSVLFLILTGERLAYIRKISRGIKSLHNGGNAVSIPLEGNNELTALAEEINIFSEKKREIERQKEALDKEKEDFIRTVSHDIRTPLTSLIGYCDLLLSSRELSEEDRTLYTERIRKKSYQIKDLTDILLDGGERCAEYFSDARLLFEQLAMEFEELIPSHTLSFSPSDIPQFSGRFDLKGLRRLFDNLASNVEKYAREDSPVILKILYDGGVTVIQENEKKKSITINESHRMGLSSIRRIAGGYSGNVTVTESEEHFKIIIALSDI